MRKALSLKSKQGSCSELEKGNKKLIACKKEGEEPGELQKRIEEYESQLQALREAAAAAETQEATPEEIEASMAPKREKTKATAAKAAPAPSPPSRRVSQKRSAQPVPPADHEVRGAKAKKSNLSAGNEKAIVPAKRTKKTSSGDDGSIETLKQANAQLQAELKDALLQLKKQPLNSPQATPPPRRAAASPPVPTSSMSASSGKSKGVNKKVPADTGDSSDGEDNPSEEARLHRLRRVCERKPSGRLNVPEHIHLQWLQGDRTTRLKMLDVLETAGWNKEEFVKMTVYRSKQKKTRKQGKTKRGWFTLEGMKETLKWSKNYINSAVKFCEKKGNEHLVKTDRYNKKLKKYYVEIEEMDEDMDEEEEIEREEETEAGNGAIFKHKKRSYAPEMAPETDDESEEEAEVDNSFQEYRQFCKYVNGLITRSTKLSDLAVDLESHTGEVDGGSAVGKRLNKSITGLHDATAVLEREFEICETLKGDTSALANGKVSEEKGKELLGKIDEQIKKTNVACAKITAAEKVAKNVLRSLKADQ